MPRSVTPPFVAIGAFIVCLLLGLAAGRLARFAERHLRASDRAGLSAPGPDTTPPIRPAGIAIQFPGTAQPPASPGGPADR